MQSGTSGSIPSFSMPTPKDQLKLGNLQATPSSTSQTILSNQDKAAISKAMDDLKQVQEATKYELAMPQLCAFHCQACSIFHELRTLTLDSSFSDWFRRIESYQKLFALPSQNSSLAESAAMCDQLGGFAVREMRCG